MEHFFDRIENIVQKEENAGYCFPKVVKSQNCVVIGIKPALFLGTLLVLNCHLKEWFTLRYHQINMWYKFL